MVTSYISVIHLCSLKLKCPWLDPSFNFMYVVNFIFAVNVEICQETDLEKLPTQILPSNRNYWLLIKSAHFMQINFYL